MLSTDPVSLLLRQSSANTEGAFENRPVEQTVVDGSLLQHTGQRKIPGRN